MREPLKWVLAIIIYAIGMVCYFLYSTWMKEFEWDLPKIIATIVVFLITCFTITLPVLVYWIEKLKRWFQ